MQTEIWNFCKFFTPANNLSEVVVVGQPLLTYCGHKYIVMKQSQITRITLARVSAPLHVRLQPVKFTVITDVLFFIALQRTTR